jgi:hypothetical protein
LHVSSKSNVLFFIASRLDSIRFLMLMALGRGDE